MGLEQGIITYGAIIIIASISFAVVAGIKGAIQIEKKNKVYRTTKFSLVISDNTKQNLSVINFS